VPWNFKRRGPEGGVWESERIPKMKALKKVLAVAVAVLAGVVLVHAILPGPSREPEEKPWCPVEVLCYFKYLK